MPSMKDGEPFSTEKNSLSKAIESKPSTDQEANSGRQFFLARHELQVKN